MLQLLDSGEAGDQTTERPCTWKIGSGSWSSLRKKSTAAFACRALMSWDARHSMQQRTASCSQRAFSPSYKVILNICELAGAATVGFTHQGGVPFEQDWKYGGSEWSKMRIVGNKDLGQQLVSRFILTVFLQWNAMFSCQSPVVLPFMFRNSDTNIASSE